MVDTPGLSDTDKNQELPNVTSILNIIKQCDMFKLVVLISANDLTERGAPIIKLLTKILRLISAEGQQNLSQFIVPFFVRFGDFKESQIDKKLDSIIKMYERKKKAIGFNDKI